MPRQETTTTTPVDTTEPDSNGGGTGNEPGSDGGGTGNEPPTITEPVTANVGALARERLRQIARVAAEPPRKVRRPARKRSRP